METLLQLLKRNGIATSGLVRKWCRRGEVAVNDVAAAMDTEVRAGDMVSIGGYHYEVVASRDPLRLRLESPVPETPALIPGTTRVYCGLHKCLTMYFRRVFGKVVRFQDPLSGSFRHFFHRLDEFYRHCGGQTISSISGHALALDRFEDVRAVRLVRDPRDLLVSGYFYHKRSAEDWCDHVDPEDADWAIVGGVVPSVLPKGKSFAQYLNEVSMEEGLLAEMEFRRKHYNSLLQWPDEDPRVRVFRYEDIVGKEAEQFRKIFEFYGLRLPARMAGVCYAGRYRAERRSGHEHIRNPGSGQWRQYFTPRLTERFNREYGPVLEKLGYPPD